AVHLGEGTDVGQVDGGAEDALLAGAGQRQQAIDLAQDLACLALDTGRRIGGHLSRQEDEAVGRHGLRHARSGFETPDAHAFSISRSASRSGTSSSITMDSRQPAVMMIDTGSTWSLPRAVNKAP